MSIPLLGYCAITILELFEFKMSLIVVFILLLEIFLVHSQLSYRSRSHTGYYLQPICLDFSREGLRELFEFLQGQRRLSLF